MIITIKKGEAKSDIEAAKKRMQKQDKRTGPALADFYGKLKGAFGDGKEYQKKIRDEWG